MTGVLIAAAAVAVLAGAIHVLIFVLESVTWSRPATWRRFGLRSQADADVVRPMALNQGFYNLFLAIGAIVGVGLLASGSLAQAGVAVLVVSLGSMLLAALVLIVSNPRLARAAATQGTAPLLALILLLVAAVV